MESHGIVMSDEGIDLSVLDKDFHELPRGVPTLVYCPENLKNHFSEGQMVKLISVVAM